MATKKVDKKIPDTKDNAEQPVKKERPQNKNLKPLGHGHHTPEEERAIRSRGGKQTAINRREKADFNRVCSLFLKIGMQNGELTPTEDIASFEDAQTKNISVQTTIVLNEYKRYLATGDKESRDWLVKHGMFDIIDKIGGVSKSLESNGIDPQSIEMLLQLQRLGLDHDVLLAVADKIGMPVPDANGLNVDAAEAAGVHIHLIRGDKPKDDGEATPNASADAGGDAE